MSEKEKVAEPNVNELPSTMFVSCNDGVKKEDIEKMNSIFPDKKIISMSEDGFKNCIDFAFNEMAEFSEQKKLTEFIRDPNNIKEVLKACWNIRQSIGNDWFTLKQLVDASEMDYKQSRAILDLVYAFGYMARKNIDKRDFWMLIDNYDSKIDYFQSVLKELKENTKGVEEILATVALEKSNAESKQPDIEKV